MSLDSLALLISFLLSECVLSCSLVFKVPDQSIFSMEAKRNVCYLHVDCAITFGCEQNGLGVHLYPRVLP